MRQLRAWLLRLGGLFDRARRDREFAQELESHVQMHTEDNLRSGMTPAEARRAALIQLGGIDATKESYRARGGVPLIENLIQDLRYGVRVLVKNPGYTFVAVLALALGIGANTALFSVVYGVLLRPLPYAQGSRLVVLHQQAPQLGVNEVGFSVKEILDYRAQSHTLDELAEYHSMQFILLGRAPDRVDTGVVSAGFFEMLGVKPLLGRTFTPSDDQPGAPPVLVLSYRYWQRAFGGDLNIVGQTFKMNDRLHTVVGVLPPIPQYPREDDVYMPTSACPFRSGAHAIENRGMRMMRLFGRLKSGASVMTASADLRAVAARMQRDYPREYPASSGFTATASALQEELTQHARPMLLLLLGTTGLVLLICCTNVANLAVARVVRREHEFAIRSALGASRARLVRQLLTESTLVALLGGLLGLVLASFSVDLLVAFVGRFTTRAAEVWLDWPVLLFTFGVSVATGLLFGALPALVGGRGMSSATIGAPHATPKIQGNAIRNSLIVTEIAVSFVLLTAAGLMTRSLAKLQRVDAGFNAEHVLTMKLPWNWSKYNNDDKMRQHDDEILRQVQAIPGVTAVGLTSAVPLDRSGPSMNTFRVEGRALDPSRPDPIGDVTVVSPDAFRALGIPFLRGRVFSAGDRQDKPLVAVVSQSLARHYWGEMDPIGKRITTDEGKHWLTVVGIVADVKQYGLERDALDTIYLSLAQQPGGNSLAIRTLSEPMGLASAVRKAITSVDAEQPVSDVKSLDQLRGESLASTRVATMLLGLFAALALVIAATGLMGVTAFLVSQRTREIGIRLALGAQVQQVLTLVLAHGMKLILFGAVLGLLLSLATGRMLQKLLFGVKPADWPTLAGVGILLVGASLAATFLPARRATRIEPMVALRCE